MGHSFGRETEPAPTGELDSIVRRVAAAPPMMPPLTAGARIGESFEIVRRIAAGGMGVVYEAKDVTLDRRVAIKVHLRGTTAAATQAMLREAQTMARIRHPNVVNVHAVGTHEDALFIAMEYVGGGTLRGWLAGGPSVAAILDAFDGAARGLAAAHAVGLVHRDFKPDNVLMDDDGRPRVADFGLARADVPRTESARPSLRDERGTRTLGDGDEPAPPATMTGAFVGTPAYAAPEQLRGEPADPRSDQFSFFVALYEALFGTLPFELEPLASLALRIEETRLVDVDPRRARHVPAAVRSVILRGLSHDREARFAGMGEAATALKRARARPRRLALAALMVVPLSGAALVLTTERTDSCDAAIEMAPVWSEERRAALAATMVGDDDDEAKRRFVATASAIDAWVSQWALQWEHHCESPPVAACLASGRLRLHALLEFFERAGGSALLFATDAVARLPDLEACTAAALPGAVASSTAELELRGRLQDAQLRYYAAPTAADIAELEALAREAEGGGYPEIAALALTTVGHRLSDHDRNAEAETVLRRAAQLAVESGEREAMVAAWSQLAKVLAENGHVDEAAEKIELARGSASAVSDIRVAALLAYHSGLVFNHVGRSAEAVEALERAVELDAQAFGPQNREVAISRELLADVLRDQGRQADARQHLEEALVINREAMGAEHPSTARLLQGLGQTCLQLGDFACAEDSLSRSRDVFSRALGESAAPTLRATTALAELWRHQGRLDEALALFERVHELSKTHEPFATPRAQTALNVAVIRATRGDWAGALPFAESGRRTIVDEIGPEHHDLVHADTTLGTILRGLGRLQESREALERAGALAKRLLDVRDRQRINAEIELGHTLLAMREHEAAASAFEEALAALADPPGPAPFVAEAEFGLARALGPSSARAREAAERALAVYEKLGPGHASTADAIRRWREDAANRGR